MGNFVLRLVYLLILYFGMLRLRKREISWAGRVKNERRHRVSKEKDVVGTLKLKKANWTGQILCRKFLLKHDIEGKAETMKR